MDNEKMSVFETQLFQFWYSMGFLPYLGLDDNGDMSACLVRLLRALEEQQPASEPVKSLADAEWSTKNIMLDCIDKAESLLGLARPSSTSLDGRLIEISIALSALLDKVKLAQKCEEEKGQDEQARMQSRAPGIIMHPPTPHYASSASSGSVYNSALSNNQYSNYIRNYYNGTYNGIFTPATTTVVSKLATLNTMHDEYFRGAFDSSAMPRDCLFDKVRHIAPDAAFSYASAIHDDNLQAVVCCVAGWGLGHCAMALPDGRLEKLAYNQLINMLMLSGTSLHHTSSPLHKAQVEAEAARATQTAQVARLAQPKTPSIFSGLAAPAAPLGLAAPVSPLGLAAPLSLLGPVKPPLFRSVAGASATPVSSGLPQPVNRNTHIPPNRPPWIHGFFRKPGPTGSVGRPPLYQPHQPYSLQPGSRHCPIPVGCGMPRHGRTVPSRMPLPSRRNKQCSIFHDDNASNATKTDSETVSDSDSSSSSSEGSVLSDSDSDSDSDSGSDNIHARRRHVRRGRSFGSEYTASVVSDNDKYVVDYDDGKSDSKACICFYGKGRKSKKCDSNDCIYDEMNEEEREQNKKYAKKQKAKKEKKTAAKKEAETKVKEAKEAKEANEAKGANEAKEAKEAKKKTKNKQSKLDKEDWDTLSGDLSVKTDTDADANSGPEAIVTLKSHPSCTQAEPKAVKTVKALKAGSVCSLSESVSESESVPMSISNSGSGSESGAGSGPKPDVAKVDIFGWMKQGELSEEGKLAFEKDAEEADKKEKAKKKADKAAKEHKDNKIKRRVSFAVV
ncbi:hypothetical protein F503_03591 [Ophiostoma piceae UAMH 11346]|uniref:Uncharacterized protein n=1 Tax=Ophiostoma piceae (strain UAMH 11346) TaxID=1262450 RepID=S3BTD0_OPHP1|nr:hypothetical protein F503_03591 [Ophiostoma piceae UAMH 11346]